MRFIFCFLLFVVCPFIFQAQVQITLSKIPTNTPITDNIFVAGSFNNWNPSDAATQFKKNAQGNYSVSLNLPQGNCEYKFTRGNWRTAECNSDGSFSWNRKINVQQSAMSVQQTIDAWEDATIVKNSTAAANVQILSNDFFMPELNRARRIWIYLPPNYNKNNSQRFPVLYLHDGQNLFDRATSFSGEWEVDESLNRLKNLGDRGCIVLGIDNGGAARLNEYSPFKNANYGGGEGDQYTEFLVNTLKPFVDKNFKTLSDRNNTAIGGSSMGGLISTYAACKHPEVFSKVLVFSPAFWFSDSCLTYTQQHVPNLPMRWYFDAGTNESETMVSNMQNVANALKINSNNAIDFFARQDGQHSEWFWDREFPDAYKRLFRK